MMVLAIIQLGDFIRVVIEGKWWKVKKRYLGLLLKKQYRSRKREEA
jgi:hypothetical protein